MRQRVGLDAELADFGDRQIVGPQLEPRRAKILAMDDSAATTELGPPALSSPVTYSYSRVEERWEIHLRPDGSARASVVVKREQQVSTDERWRFVARRGLPGEAVRRPRRRLAAAAAALVAIIAGGWLAWSAWPRHAAAEQLVTIPIAKAPVAASPPPLVAPPPPAAPVSPPAARVARAEVPKVPVVLPQQVIPAETPDRSLSQEPDRRPLDRRPAVQSAVARAFASGEAEPWTDGDLTGFVVVGPVDMVDGATCRNTVILGRGGPDGDQTTSRRRCQAADGSIRISEGQ